MTEEGPSRYERTSRNLAFLSLIVSVVVGFTGYQLGSLQVRALQEQNAKIERQITESNAILEIDAWANFELDGQFVRSIFKVKKDDFDLARRKSVELVTFVRIINSGKAETQVFYVYIDVIDGKYNTEPDIYGAYEGNRKISSALPITVPSKKSVTFKFPLETYRKQLLKSGAAEEGLKLLLYTTDGPIYEQTELIIET